MVSFTEFYQSVHGRPPFPWQERLARRAVGGEWPKAITVPTGCGKTSVIDVAVYALACQAGSAERTAAMRTFFVVDRRLVVDDVYEHAKALARAINEEGKAEWVRDQLCRFGGEQPLETALETAILRGGMYRSDSWADAPNQPLVCVSTVDQVGSRLLFRGYGVSDLRRPVDAGLVGNDSLIILDEAHLSEPFAQTLGWVERYQGQPWREMIPIPGVQFVQMSASIDGGFGLEADDLACKALQPRLQAQKLAELKEASDLGEAAAAEARRMARDGARVVGVVLNTVAAARRVFETLEGEKLLLTGRVRPFDRDTLVEKYHDRMCAGRRPRDNGSLFVVATQTVEVGADLDFDALVTEAAPLDALRQRFGRLDRLGELQSTQAVILKPKRAKESEWIYGQSLEETWKWLKERGSPIDFGVQAMADAPVRTRRADAPLMFPVHVDAWAQTNPAPAADPDVAPFLHGAQAVDTADVQIVWRADLAQNRNDWLEILAAVPPVSTEALALPIAAARRWLNGKTFSVADVEGVSLPEEESHAGARRNFALWRGPDPTKTDFRGLVSSIRPGDTIVVPSSAGGCDCYGWNPDSNEPVADIGDLCANERAAQGGGRFRLRVHPAVWELREGETHEQIQALLDRVEADDEEAIDELKAMVDARLEGQWSWRNYGAGTALLIESKTRKPRRTTATDETDEDDNSSFTSPPRPIWLDEHMERVARMAGRFVEAAGLRNGIALGIERAAELHDLGKWDTRFQLKLGNTGARPRAKGDGRRRRDSEYPKGARHEFASVKLAEKGVAWPAECDRDLVLYLIGTHHGFGRPFPPVWEENTYKIKAEINGKTIIVTNVPAIAKLESGWAERFCKLNRKYGWWGLAYLEAIVRRADCVRSREEEDEEHA